MNASEVVDEVQATWKMAYRLSRLFSGPEARGPFRCAMTLKTKVEKLRVHLPLMEALCNPGLKPRHWAQMSQRVGLELTPHAEPTPTTFADMLQLGLETPDTLEVRPRTALVLLHLQYIYTSLTYTALHCKRSSCTP